MHHIVIGEFVFAVGDKTPISKMERVSNGAYSEVSVMDGSKSEFTGNPSILSILRLSGRGMARLKVWTR